MRSKKNAFGVFRKMFLMALLAQSFGAVQVEAVETNQGSKFPYSDVNESENIKETELSKFISASLNKTDRELRELVFETWYKCRKEGSSAAPRDEIKGLMGHMLVHGMVDKSDMESTLEDLRCTYYNGSDLTSHLIIEVIAENRHKVPVLQDVINDFISRRKWTNTIVYSLRDYKDSPYDCKRRRYDAIMARVTEIVKLADKNSIVKLLEAESLYGAPQFSVELLPYLDPWMKNVGPALFEEPNPHCILRILPWIEDGLARIAMDDSLIKKEKKSRIKSIVKNFEYPIIDFLEDQLEIIENNPNGLQGTVKDTLDALFLPPLKYILTGLSKRSRQITKQCRNEPYFQIENDRVSYGNPTDTDPATNTHLRILSSITYQYLGERGHILNTFCNDDNSFCNDDNSPLFNEVRKQLYPKEQMDTTTKPVHQAISSSTHRYPEESKDDWVELGRKNNGKKDEQNRAKAASIQSWTIKNNQGNDGSILGKRLHETDQDQEEQIDTWQKGGSRSILEKGSNKERGGRDEILSIGFTNGDGLEDLFHNLFHKEMAPIQCDNGTRDQNKPAGGQMIESRKQTQQQKDEIMAAMEEEKRKATTDKDLKKPMMMLAPEVQTTTGKKRDNKEAGKNSHMQKRSGTKKGNEDAE